MNGTKFKRDMNYIITLWLRVCRDLHKPNTPYPICASARAVRGRDEGYNSYFITCMHVIGAFTMLCAIYIERGEYTLASISKLT